MKQERLMNPEKSITEIKEGSIKETTAAKSIGDEVLDPHSFFWSAYSEFLYNHKSPWSA